MAKKRTNKSKNLVIYVDNSIPRSKHFKSEKSAMKFINDFVKNSPGPSDGYWVDFLITDIRGKILPMDVNPE